MAATKISDGVDLFIWNLYTQFQALHALSMQSAQIAFSKKIIGNSLRTWQYFTVYSVGPIFSQLVFSNIHFWISRMGKRSKICFGLTWHHALCTSSFARSTKESSQSTREGIFILIVKLIRDRTFEELTKPLISNHNNHFHFIQFNIAFNI